ncbi:unnamed protein product [Dicrocoelium dendriticum]|nr:unnamed protein product [Dicrocoelium dendriticum]
MEFATQFNPFAMTSLGLLDNLCQSLSQAPCGASPMTTGRYFVLTNLDELPRVVAQTGRKPEFCILSFSLDQPAAPQPSFDVMTALESLLVQMRSDVRWSAPVGTTGQAYTDGKPDARSTTDSTSKSQSSGVNETPSSKIEKITDASAQADAARADHERMERVKPFRCSFDGCTKAYYSHGHLVEHSRIHTGVKALVCPFPDCGARFMRSDQLSRHRLKHTGERKFACPHCDRRFMRNDHLKKHMLTAYRSKTSQ